MALYGLLSKDGGKRAEGLRWAAETVLTATTADIDSMWATASEAFMKGGAWEEVHIHGPRLAGPKLDALLLLVIVFPYLPRTVVADPVLWGMLLYGIQIRDSNRQHRKAAMLVLRRALQLLRPDSALSGAWELYLLLCDGLEDMATHLILELWPRVQELAEPLAGAGGDGPGAWSCEGSHAVPIPDPAGSVPGPWLAALFNRAFTSDAAQSKRSLMLASLGAADLMRDGGNSTTIFEINASAAAPGSSEQGSVLPEDLEPEAGQGDPLQAVGASAEPVYGDYVGSYVKKGWQTSGPHQVADEAGAASAITPAGQQGRAVTPWLTSSAILARMPPWYIAGGQQFLACLQDNGLFSGASGSFGRALARFLVGYGRKLVSADVSRAAQGLPQLYPSFIRQLVLSLPQFAFNKGGMKALLGTLPLMPLPAGSASNASADVLDARCLSELRWAMLSQSHVNTRTLSETLLRQAARVVMRFGGLLPSGQDQTTVLSYLFSLGQCLSSIPSSVIMDRAVHTAYPITTAADGKDGAGSKGSVQAEVMAWAAKSPADSVGTALTAAVSAYLAPTGNGTEAQAASAPAVSRLVALGSGSMSQPQLLAVLEPLRDVLARVYSHSYLDGGLKTRALLLLRALLCVARPGGGCGDIHLTRVVNGSAVPIAWYEYAEPLFLEWSAANRAMDARHAAGVSAGPAADTSAPGPRPGAVDCLAAVSDVPGSSHYDYVYEALQAPEEVAMPSRTSTGARPVGVATANDRSGTAVSSADAFQDLQAALAALLLPEAVSSEVASCLEACISPGLTLAGQGSGPGFQAGLWSPDFGEGLGPNAAGRHGSDTAGQLLTTSFNLALLRDCVRACPRAGPFASTVARRVARAGKTLRASCLQGGRAVDGGAVDTRPLKLEPAAAVGHAHALHVLSVLLCTLLPYSTRPALLPEEGSEAASGQAMLAMLRDLAGAALHRPVGAEEPALPFISAATEGQAALLRAAAPAGLQETPWLAVRTLAERARWAAVAAILSHGAVHGWGTVSAASAAAKGKPTSFAGLPVSLAEPLAEAICSAVDSAGDNDTAVVMGLAAWIAPFCLGDSEDEAEVAAVLSAWTGRPCVPLTSVRLADLLAALGQQAWSNRPTRGDLLAYTAAALHPALFLRPTLHRPGGTLMKHLVKAWTVLSDDAHISLCAQIFGSRLLSAYMLLLDLAGRKEGPADGPSAVPAKPSAATAVLSAHAPFIVALLMHREFVLPWDEPQLVDSHTRAQMLAWMQHRADTQADRPASQGYWKDGCPEVLQELQAVGAGGQAANSAPAAPAAATSSLDPASLLPSRGAGAVTRVQALLFLEDSGRRAAAGNGAAALVLQRVMLQLLRLNSTTDWRKEMSAGSPPHAARIRAWQAIALIAGAWGQQDRAAAGQTGQFDLYGQAYDNEADMWHATSSNATSSSSLAQASSDALALLDRLSLAGRASDIGRAGVKKGGQGQGKAAAQQKKKAGHGAAEEPSPTPYAVGMGEDDAASAMSTPHAPAVVALAVVHAAFRYIVCDPQTPSLRHYVEATMVALGRRFPSASIQHVLLPQLQLYNPKSQAAFSMMLVCADAAKHVAAWTAKDRANSRGLECAGLGKNLLSAIFPWLTSPVGLVRLLAQLALDDAVPLLFPSVAAELTGTAGQHSGSGGSTQPPASPEDAGLRAWVLPALKLVRGCAEVHTMVQRQRKNLARITPERACSLAGILCSPITEHGELVPWDVYSSVRTTFQALTVAMHVRDPLFLAEEDCVPPGLVKAVAAGLLPKAAIKDARLRHGLEQGLVTGSAVTGTGSDGPDNVGSPQSSAATPSSAAGAFNYQRKVLSASEETGGALVNSVAGGTAGGSNGVAGRATTAGSGAALQAFASTAGALVQEALAAAGYSSSVDSAAADAAEGQAGADASAHGVDGDLSSFIGSSTDSKVAHAATMALRAREHPLLTCRDESGRPYQPLIVVASLVDKPPNLGGLARTCEIFSAESLVVHDLRIRDDQQFRDISVTAADWMPLHECPPDVASLKAYLRARKAQGYTVAALEQASRSVMLGSTQLPDKLVLLLGAEKEGVPSQLLAEVDVVLEIPQTGMIRSLNVHVSAAMVVWTYTRQRLDRAAAGKAR